MDQIRNPDYMNRPQNNINGCSTKKVTVPLARYRTLVIFFDTYFSYGSAISITTSLLKVKTIGILIKIIWICMKVNWIRIKIIWIRNTTTSNYAFRCHNKFVARLLTLRSLGIFGSY